MRVLLVTGKGGVGKTTVAAATAARAAAHGGKTLLLSAGPAGTLADVLGTPVGPAMTEVDTGFCAVEVDTQGCFDELRAGILGRLRHAGGVADPVAAQDAGTVLPGLDHLLLLREVREQATRWDTVVVDGPPTPEMLRLLALPEALIGYLDRAVPTWGTLARTLWPVLGRFAGAALPGAAAHEAVTRLRGELDAAAELLHRPATTVRLVTAPRALDVADLRRAVAALALHGHRPDTVVVNPVAAPGPAPEPVRAALREICAGLPVRTAPHHPGDGPVGVAELLDLAERLYEGADPVAPAPDAPTTRLDRDGDTFEYALRLPLVTHEHVTLTRTGDRIAVTVHGNRRVMTLPSVLRRCVTEGAVLRDGWLSIRFRPDPDLWPSPRAGRDGAAP